MMRGRVNGSPHDLLAHQPEHGVRGGCRLDLRDCGSGLVHQAVHFYRIPVFVPDDAGQWHLQEMANIRRSRGLRNLARTL